MGKFKFYGQEPGLKAQDLQKYAGNLSESSFLTPDAYVIGSEFFNRFLKINKLSEHSPKLSVLRGNAINLYGPFFQILEECGKSIPMIARSSALSERGGSGIYRSCLFFLSGDEMESISSFKHAAKAVYAGEFSPSARLYRAKHDKPLGMGIIVQPVVGENFGDRYCPLLSGSAYTDYDGKPLVRWAPGLRLDGDIGEGLIYNSPPDKASLARGINGISQVFMLDPSSEMVATEPLPDSLKSSISVEFFLELFAKIEKLSRSGSFYLEWAAIRNPAGGFDIYAVQISPFEQKISPAEDVDEEISVVLASSRDIVNYGCKECRAVVLVSSFSWDRHMLSILEIINEGLKDYLLIVPDAAFSRMSEMLDAGRLEYCHFSNAAVILERQKKLSVDDMERMLRAGMPLTSHVGKGGMHFQQLCDREDILFIGAEFDTGLLENNMHCHNYGARFKIFEIPVLAVNDPEKKTGTVYLQGPSRVPVHTNQEVRQFADKLYDLSGRPSPHWDKSVQDAMFVVRGIVIGVVAEQGIIGFDPFLIGNRSGIGTDELKKHFSKVIDVLNSEKYHKMIGYLEKLKLKL